MILFLETKVPCGLTTIEAIASGINYAIQSKYGMRDILNFKEKSSKRSFRKKLKVFFKKWVSRKRMVYRSKDFKGIVNHRDLPKVNLYELLTVASVGNFIS